MKPVKKPEIDLVLSGGATNFIQMLAAAFGIQERYAIARAGGSSAGMLASTFLAFGGTADDALDLCLRMVVGDRLLDKNAINIPMRFGLCGGDALRAAVRSFVGDKTMGEAKVPLFGMVGDIYFGEPLCVSSWEHPNALVQDVCVASAAVPVLFAMQEIRFAGGKMASWGNRKFVDGGLAMNFAMNRFDDSARPTIGLRVKQSREANPVRAWDMLAWAKGIGRLFMHSSDNAYISQKNFSSVVDVPAADGFDFSLTEDEIRRRWALGLAVGRAVRIDPAAFPVPA